MKYMPLGTAAALLIGLSAVSNAEETRVHGLSVYGDLKYEADFPHFDYANPAAPKGGNVKLPAIGTFDNLNAWILKGLSPSGITNIYDTLTVSSLDEPFTEYGLIAESIEVPEDKSWATYHLRPEARWHDGKPLTAEDVAWTMEILKTEGHPFYKSYYSSVDHVEVIDPHTARFVFNEKHNAELPLIVGQLSILPKHYYENREFNETTLEPPLGGGPYRITKVDAGHSITYQRVEDYWARDLPVKLGADNFDSISYIYFRDATIALEALKSGDVDFRQENVSKNWHTLYDFPALNEGRVIKEDIPDQSSMPMQAFIMNMRKAKYADKRVRQAIGLAYDFEWMNKNFFYGAYKRNSSYFQNSELAATGLPEGGELAILEKYRDQLPEELFTTEFAVPVTDGKGNPRRNYRKALGLLKEAGWEVRDRKLTNVETGEHFTMEFITVSPSMEKIALAYKKSLERIGIEMRVRMVDSSQYVELIESFEFDSAVLVLAQSESPGNEQRSFWSSAAADEKGSRNYGGIKHPAIDEIIELIITADSRQSQIDATRALDRILLWNHYVVPQYFGDTYRVAYWNKFSRPEILPTKALGFNYWWVDPDKDAALKR